MNHVKGLLLSCLFFCLFLAGCGSALLAQNPPAPHVVPVTQQGSTPLTLQVVRRDQASQNPVAPRTWTITDTHAISQLLGEIQRLPIHHNVGADSCARPSYTYTLDFFTGATRTQHDELYSYCLTLTAANGSEHDPTPTFYSLLTGMLHLSQKELRGW